MTSTCRPRLAEARDIRPDASPMGWITVLQAEARTGIGRGRLIKAIEAGHLLVQWHIHPATGRPAQYLDPASSWLADTPPPRTHKFNPVAAAAIVARVDEGESVAAIAADLDVTESAIYRVAARHGRTFAPPAPALDMAQVEEAAQLYTSGMSTTELGRRYNVSSGTVAKALRGRGVRLRAQPEAKRRKRWRYHAFTHQDCDTAYWVGFIQADGSLQIPKTKSSPSLAVVINDKEHLEAFCDWLCLDRGDIRPLSRPSSSVLAWGVSITHPDLVDQLRAWGVLPRKSWTWWGGFNVPDGLLADFLRGWFDGDGWVSPPGDALSVTGQADSIRWFGDALQRLGYIGNFQIRQPHHHTLAHELRIGGRQQTQEALHLLGGTPGPRLARKWNGRLHHRTASAPEVCRVLGLRSYRFERLIQSGEVPHDRSETGTFRYFDIEEVRAALIAVGYWHRTLNSRELAERLKLSFPALKRVLDLHAVPFTRYGNHRLFNEDEVRAAIGLSRGRCLSLEECAAAVGLRASQLHGMITAGVIPFSNPTGGKRFFDPAEVSAIASQRHLRSRGCDARLP
jgi:hypothetical protein